MLQIPWGYAQDSMAGRQLQAVQTHMEDFEFTELLFVKSSRMSKRWLVFSCTIMVRHASSCISHLLHMHSWCIG